MLTKKELLKLLENYDDDNFIFMLNDSGIPIPVDKKEPIIDGNIKLQAVERYQHEVEDMVIPVLVFNPVEASGKNKRIF